MIRPLLLCALLSIAIALNSFAARKKESLARSKASPTQVYLAMKKEIAQAKDYLTAYRALERYYPEPEAKNLKEHEKDVEIMADDQHKRMLESLRDRPNLPEIKVTHEMIRGKAATLSVETTNKRFETGSVELELEATGWKVRMERWPLAHQ